jgi:nucleoside phosphorylase
MLILAAAQEELGELQGEVVGIGSIVAAANAARLIERHHPERVVLLGTGSAYPAGPAIGNAIVGGRFGLAYGVEALGLAYVPRAPAPISSDPELVARIGLPQHNILTAGAVTTDLDLAERLSDGWTVEHLEAYGIAHACAQAGIPFTAVIGITSQVGPEAHLQWLTHRDEAQQAARRAITPLLN